MEEKNEEKYIKRYIIDNSLIEWIKSHTDKPGSYIHEMRGWSGCISNQDDLRYLHMTGKFILLLGEFCIKTNKPINRLDGYVLKYKDELYSVGYDFECEYIIQKIDRTMEKYIIDYEEFRSFCKKNMDENFDLLKQRVIDSLNNTNLKEINKTLLSIDKPTLVSGVGGSSVVSEYMSKVLSKKNHIITKNIEPRDFNYIDESLYRNVLSCSYSANNYGVNLSFNNNLNHYLFSTRNKENNDITYLTYSCEMERSFISLGATLVPCSIILQYYQNGNFDNMEELIKEVDFSFETKCDAFEIFSGYDTSVPARFLESTFTESGLAIPIVHDKYDYCHGRSTMSINYNNIAIYFNANTELDKLMLDELPKYYKDIIVFDYTNDFESEYRLLVKCMYLAKYIAENKNKDLSGVEYSPIVKKLYRYKGEL